MAFDPEFLQLMPDTLLAQPGTLDAFGKFTASGAALSLSCRIEGRQIMTRDSTGREVVSSRQAVMAGVNDLTVDGYRYTLPAPFSPRDDLVAIGIDRESDEDGPCY